MQIFAVIGTDSEQRAEIVQSAVQAYTDANVYRVRNAVFIASSGGETTQEVSVKLGIGDDERNFTGIVVTVNYYWGFYAKELWEWLSARSRANGS